MAQKISIQELLDNGLINADQAQAINAYYTKKSEDETPIIFYVLAIVGVVLIALGIISFFAFNWDHYSLFTKNILAFLPTLVAQGFCAWVMYKKELKNPLNEIAATFLFFVLPTSISIIAQNYQLQSDIASFLITWLLMAAPVMYVMRSYLANFFYLLICGALALEHLENSTDNSIWIFWGLLALALPMLLYALHKKKQSAAMRLSIGVLPLVALLGTLIVFDDQYTLIALVYVLIFGLYKLCAPILQDLEEYRLEWWYFRIGELGTLIILLITSFEDYWSNFYDRPEEVKLMSLPSLLAILLFIKCMSMLFYKGKEAVVIPQFDVSKFGFLAFSIITVVCMFSPEIFAYFAAFLINVLIVFYGVYLVYLGRKNYDLVRTNLGVIILCVWIFLRFMTTDYSLLIKGAVFVIMGVLFLLINYNIIKEKRAQ